MRRRDGPGRGFSLGSHALALRPPPLLASALPMMLAVILMWSPPSGRPLLLGLLFVIGVAAGAGAVCAPAIKADIIDFDEYQTGERKEGAYLAVWNFVRKCSGAVTPVLAMGSLQLSGYQPNVEQSELTQWVIRGLFGLFPGICFVAGICIFLRFRFKQREHAAIRGALDARR